MKATISKAPENFYVVGGTMRHDAPSYVEREADEELFTVLMGEEFCHVLTARQMGKSSLMLRTAARLRNSGVRVAVLDLTAIGQNLTTEQWYCGLILQIGNRLDLEDDLLDFWATQTWLGPMQRWMSAIQKIVLPKSFGQLVIFIDEIDAVRSLNFSTDEFFAGIRECYNLRNINQEIRRLTFCLIGVATPSDLIRDTRTTPFNIGKRIELNDFTQEEARSLADGLRGQGEQNRAILKRILYWTDGHPYLTQRICQAVVETETIRDAVDVDQLIEELFFSKRAQEYDDNLIFVRERLLRSGADLTALLNLYAKVRRGKIVPDVDSDPLVSILRLSGVTRVEKGLLRVRNRIYERVFNKAWVTANLPEFEARRQREAYRRGVWRTAIVSTMILAVVITLALLALWQRNRALEQMATNKRLLYMTQMKLANQDWQNANISHLKELLEATKPLAGEEDLRGFEWHLFWNYAHGEVFRLQEDSSITSVKFLPNSNVLAIAETEHTMLQGNREHLIKLYDQQARTELSSFRVPADKFDIAVFSPDLQWVATDGLDGNVTIWELQSGQNIRTLQGHTNSITAAAFSPDKRYLASADQHGVLIIWNTRTGQKKSLPLGFEPWLPGLAFSPDGRLLALTDESTTIHILDTDNGKALPAFSIETGSLVRTLFSQDGKSLAATTKDGRLYIWDLLTRQRVSYPLTHSSEILSLAFSPDRKTLATCSTDRTVKLWDIKTGDELRTIRGHGSKVTSVDWSSNGKLLVTGDGSGTIKIWEPFFKAPLTLPDETVTSYRATIFSPDGELMALGITDDEQVKLWNLSTGKTVASLEKFGKEVLCAAFSKDAQTVAIGGTSHIVRVYKVSTGELITTFSGHQSDVYGLDFSPDGNTIISGERGNLKLWEASSGRELASPDSGNSYFRAVFSPDGKSLASADQDGAVRLWNLASLRIIQTFIGHAKYVRFIAFSPDGRFLATGGDDNTVKVWEVATGKKLRELAQSDSIPRFTFTLDGKRLVTGGEDGSVKLWDVTDMREVVTLREHGDRVTSITFSRDGTTLAVGSNDGTVKAWQAAQAGEPDTRPR